MKVVIFNASERFKENLNTFAFSYEASQNESGRFNIVVYPGQVEVNSTGVILKTDDGFSGYVIKMTYDHFSSMIFS